MDKELMDFLNKYTSYDFGYIKTTLYINEEGKLESQFNQTEDSSDITSYGFRQTTLLYGVDKYGKDYVTSTITILDNKEGYDLLENGILKIQEASKKEIKKHVLFRNYAKENLGIPKERQKDISNKIEKLIGEE